MKAMSIGIILSLGILGSTPAGASTTYSVNGAPGNVLGVTGTITTDGNSGFLSASDIMNWSLTIPATSGGVTFTLNNTNSSVTAGTNLVFATPATLSFNFSNSTLTTFAFQNASQYSVSWFAFGGTTGGMQEIGDGPCSFCFANSPPLFGTEIIGIAPLPAGLPLFATGVGLLGLLGWRKRKKHDAQKAGYLSEYL